MFNGLSENYFKLLEPVMEEWVNKKRVGRKLHPWRPVLNSIFWILATGATWWALPKGKDFAHRSTAHSWLGRMEKDGVLEEILSGLIEIAEMIGGVDPERLSIDGFFSGGRGGGEQVEYGYKGKGVTNHLLVEAEGRPLVVRTTSAKGDEREQVNPLLKKVKHLTAKTWKKGKVSVLEADKGYDAQRVKVATLKNKVFPLIPYRKGSRAEIGLCYLEKFRWKVERTIAWLKTRYRRISTRWERRVKYWNGFLQCALIRFWLKFLSKKIF